MEITITKTEKIDVTFPMYAQDIIGVYALFSEKDGIQVMNYGGADTNKAIRKVTANVALMNNWYQITEKQFADFYKQTATEIWEACESFLDSLDEKRTEASDPAQDEMDYQRTRQTV